MANSKDAINRVIYIEGGFVNHPSDKGGPTKYGITQKVYEEFLKRKVSIDEIKNMPIGNAFTIYKINFWDKIQGDNINTYSKAYAIFDQAVNWGVSRAIKRVQRVLNEPETGVLTEFQLRLLNDIDEQAFIDSYLEFSRQHYLNLVKENPDYEAFINGWLNRVEKIRSYVYSKFQKILTNAVVNAKENAIPISIVIGSILIAGYFIYKQGDKNGNKPILAI